MIEWIQHIDETLLYTFHVQWGSKLLDEVIPFFRNPYFWSPLYLFLLIFIWMNTEKKVEAISWYVLFFMTFVFCDFISASLIKPWVHRIRPCHNEALSFTIRSLIPCGSGFSFPSSHASNHVGMAIFMIVTLKERYKWIVWLAITWAFLVCYAQMYVCLHYPSDILGGSLLGVAIGWYFGHYYLRRFGKKVQDKIEQNTTH